MHNESVNLVIYNKWTELEIIILGENKPDPERQISHFSLSVEASIYKGSIRRMCMS